MQETQTRDHPKNTRVANRSQVHFTYLPASGWIAFVALLCDSNGGKVRVVRMRIVITSDTHLSHQKIDRLEGDVLIHCGDFYDGYHCEDPNLTEINHWFSEQDFAVKLLVGGNHDFPIFKNRKNIKELLNGVVYLEDSRFRFGGLLFYGTPWIPDLHGWAYYCGDKVRKEVWKMIPDNLDFLITHTPPHGILDHSSTTSGLGCRSLGRRVQQVSPRFHCFGHIHAGYGRIKTGHTDFINAAASSRTRDFNAPFEIEVEPKEFARQHGG